ncbi:hypothetical protein LOK49_LG06G03153 [Camellia lanceoleosa]|uniref:Uncharacterized protein n=1 Tax=Camellia lanceoleosa TaxID=1840588 RepID=A0ACC0HGS9_9ERIC|nr:hypothetical protein LOK49_LG06G03153 [Camellia lanceoleosa]
MESGSGEGSMMDDYKLLISTTDAELLKRSWRNEKAAPEILQFELSRFEIHEETVEESMTSGVNPLTISLYQMDLDMTQFLLRSYIRIRL